MAKFRPAPNLDQNAAKAARAAVDAAADPVKRQAEANAPGVKQWVTQHDGNVRHTHVAADGQKRPENLRYDIPSMPWDMGEGRREDNMRGFTANRVGPVTHFFYDSGPHAAQPGNFEEALKMAYTNAVSCRCYTEIDPNGLSREIKADPAKAVGSKCKAKVHVTAPYAVEAELGDQYNLGDRMGEVDAKGTHFMENAARETAKRLKFRSR